MAFKVVLVDDDLLVLQDLETLADWGNTDLLLLRPLRTGWQHCGESER